jgi:hypothetical protein
LEKSTQKKQLIDVSYKKEEVMWNPWLFGMCKKCCCIYFKKSEEEGVCKTCWAIGKAVENIRSMNELDRKMKEESEMGKTEVKEHVNPPQPWPRSPAHAHTTRRMDDDDSNISMITGAGMASMLSGNDEAPSMPSPESELSDNEDSFGGGSSGGGGAEGDFGSGSSGGDD